MVGRTGHADRASGRNGCRDRWDHLRGRRLRHSPQWGFLGTLEALDTTTNTWRTLAPMPTPRGFGAAAAVDGRLYVIAGNVAFATPGTDVEVYDPATNQWSSLSPFPEPLFYLSATIDDGLIYVTGGTSAGTTGATQIYDPLSNLWTTGPDLQIPRNRHVSETVGERIVVTGGATTSGLGQAHQVTGATEILDTGPGGISINAGLNDAWIEVGTEGQGFLITVFPDLELLFLAWFTYDLEQPEASIEAMLGDPGHRWLTAQGPYEGDTAVLDIVLTAGGVFDSALPRPESDTEYGEIILTFSTCNQADLLYDIPSLQREGRIELTRIVTDNVPLCEALSEP